MATPFELLGARGSNQIWMVVFTLNRREYLRQALHSIREHEPDIRILVIDNGSSDGTPEFLASALGDGIVDKVLLNRNEHVPQWQKAFNIHQAWRMLAVEPCEYLMWMDDDVLVREPFAQTAKKILATLQEEQVKIVSLLTDERQNAVHPTIAKRVIDGVEVRIKHSFNGAMVFFPAVLLREIGLPPLREGADNLSVEDWYYSRLLRQREYCIAAIDIADHMGAGDSMRVQLTGGDE